MFGERAMPNGNEEFEDDYLEEEEDEEEEDEEEEEKPWIIMNLEKEGNEFLGEVRESWKIWQFRFSSDFFLFF